MPTEADNLSKANAENTSFASVALPASYRMNAQAVKLLESAQRRLQDALWETRDALREPTVDPLPFLRQALQSAVSASTDIRSALILASGDKRREDAATLQDNAGCREGAI